MEGLAFVCPRCGRRFPAGERTVCSAHSGDTDPGDGSASDGDPDHSGNQGDRTGLTLEVVYDIETLREAYDPARATRTDIWRYRPFLPVEGPAVTLGEGWTALVAAERLGDDLGVDLSLKLEDANPTGATKDRGSAVVATYAREQGYGTVACASTGNAAASTAAYAAHGGLSCSLFVPGDLPEPKGVQPLVYGADVHRVEGTYADASEQCREATHEQNWADRSAGATPYAPAGARTLGFELAEQTRGGDRDETGAGAGGKVGVPEWVVVPVGNGGTIAGVWEGFRTFADLGYVEETPRMLGVQAAGASAIHDAFHAAASGDDAFHSDDYPSRGAGDERSTGNEYRSEDESRPAGESHEKGEHSASAVTCADSIAVSNPHHAREACTALADSGGTSVTVSDEEILESVRRLGREEGVFAEPASASVVAGIETARDRGVIDAGDRVVAVVTGTGLKDVSSVAQFSPVS